MTETVIGNYRIISELGQGACGRVYLAQHTVLEKRVAALKLMHNVPLHEHQEKTLFLQESHMLEVLRHPYILPIIDAGINEGLPYIVTEYAPNGSLRQLLNQHINQPLSQEKALSILAQIGSALHYAHEQQVVHRDLKPENILFNAQGNALIADFGLAITLASMSMHVTTQAGTPAYMAPEQVQGVVSREGDQYALGCIAYELFTGHHLFTAPNIAVMMFNHLYTVPVPPSEHNPDIAPHIEEAILKALAKDRHDRHTDIAAFLTALEAPSVAAEVLTYTRPISLSDEDKKTLSQNATLLPTLALDMVTPLLATQLASNPPIEVTDRREADKHNGQQAQYVSLSNDPFRLKQRRILVASASLLILAVVMIPFLFQLQPSGTKGTLAIAPPILKTTPFTQPRQHSTSKNSAVQTPQATALVLPQPGVTTISTGAGIATPTETPTDIPTYTPSVATPTEIPIATATDVPVVIPTATPLVTPTDTPVVVPTDTPVPTPLVTPTDTPGPTPIVTPTDTPIVTPTATPLVVPTDTPVPTPTNTPTTG